MGKKVTAGVVACVLFFGGCDALEREPPAAPPVDSVAPFYSGHARLLSVEMDGNVVQLRFEQPVEQLRRGGTLWARVGPFISLLSPSTRDLFVAHPGVAAVEVETVLPDGRWVGRALLRRDALTPVLWRRTLNLLGHALQAGRDEPRRLAELRDWGEEHTTYEYNPEFVTR